ncbi:AMP-dependent synthetase/ligase [Lacisediminimonas profundi]|uniref:AMP-dependent synthetase/ligase n=1 Tax=Lacisediminimonas profundi TaxID=2603856 RepID=UPI00138755F6|nr:AMP-binding protein [Lacisediminimonas profundi]
MERSNINHGGQSSDALSTLPRQLWQHAVTRPDAVAIREKHLGIWQQVSWRMYLDHVRRFTMGLVELGIRPGDAVAIQAENCQEWLYSDLAVQCAGAVVTTVYPTSSVEEVRHILENSGARVLIAGDQEHLDKVLELRDQGLVIDRVIVFDPKGVGAERGGLVLSYKDVEVLGAKRDAQDPSVFEAMLFAVTPDSIYDVMYTSGTSGAPKGALCEQRGPVEGARAMMRAMPIDSRDEWLSYLPLSHAFERIMSIAVHLGSGCVVNFADSIDTVQSDVAEIQPSVFGAVPRIMEKIKTAVEIRMGKSTALKKWLYRWSLAVGQRRVARQRKNIEAMAVLAPRQPIGYDQVQPMVTRWTLADRIGHGVAYWLVLRHLKKHIGLLHTRYLICGAAPMSADLFEYYMALGVPIINAFGMTELHNIPTGSLPGQDARGTVGHVFPGWEAMKTEEGELLLRGPIGFRGYKGQESEPFSILDAHGWLHTGDLCEIYQNGYISIVGRKKDVLITSGGKNISPEQVENCLKASPYISEAVVIGDGRHYLTALIELDADAVGDLLQQRGIAYTTLRDMAANPEVVQLIRQEVEQSNGKLARVETVKKFAILPRDLSHDDGEMTPTRKVKRAQMEKQFCHLIEAMYAGNGGGSGASGGEAQVVPVAVDSAV